MLYQLLYNLTNDYSFLNVTRYISFRSIIALLSALAMGIFFTPWFIRFLKKKSLGQVVRNDGPKSHLTKQNIPTMGGTIIVFSILLSSLLWVDWKNHFLWYIVIITTSFTIIGFVDDYLKITKKNSAGLSGKLKLLFQFLVTVMVCYHNFITNPGCSSIYIPFVKSLSFDLGYFYVVFSSIVIVGTSNAVNLTDGLDGLAIGPLMTSALCYSILSYVSGNYIIANYLKVLHVSNAAELTIISSCLIGAGLAFLWYNTYPAQVFMGDVGSLPLGGILGAIAVFSKHEILLVIIGGVFVLEAVSVITQVLSFKLTGRRIFRMAPLHHHFELKGWAEPKVIVRFWIIALIFALIGILSLKIR